MSRLRGNGRINEASNIDETANSDYTRQPRSKINNAKLNKRKGTCRIAIAKH